MKTPNCKICEWSTRVNYAVIGEYVLCSAQGRKWCSEVYNNKSCIKLYKEKKNE